MRRSLVVIAMAASTVSCFLRPPWDADVAIVSLGIRQVEVLQTTAVFTLRIDNAEPRALLLDGSVHEIEIDGWEVGRGLYPDPVEVPRLDSVFIEVPVYIDNVSAVRRLRDIIESKRFRYRVHSTLHVVRGTGTRRAHVTHEGLVELERRRSPAR